MPGREKGSLSPSLPGWIAHSRYLHESMGPHMRSRQRVTVKSMKRANDEKSFTIKGHCSPCFKTCLRYCTLHTACWQRALWLNSTLLWCPHALCLMAWHRPLCVSPCRYTLGLRQWLSAYCPLIVRWRVRRLVRLLSECPATVRGPPAPSSHRPLRRRPCAGSPLWPPASHHMLSVICLYSRGRRRGRKDASQPAHQM
jgi:hypothetical protein